MLRIKILLQESLAFAYQLNAALKRGDGKMVKELAQAQTKALEKTDAVVMAMILNRGKKQ